MDESNNDFEADLQDTATPEYSDTASLKRFIEARDEEKEKKFFDKAKASRKAEKEYEDRRFNSIREKQRKNLEKVNEMFREQLMQDELKKQEAAKRAAEEKARRYEELLKQIHEERLERLNNPIH